MNQEKFDLLKQVAAASMVPFILVGGPLLGFFLGDWVDRRFLIAPYGKLVFMALGIGASVQEIVQIIRRILKSGS